MSRPEEIARRAALISIGVSVVLASAKISVGLAARSVAVVSDGLESAADVATSGLVLFGLWVASKPADADHPYGHGRVETLSGLAIGIFLAISGVAISFRAIAERHDQHVPELFAIWPLIASIVVKTVQFGAKYRIGRKTGSSALIADAWHDSVDVLSGTIALLGLGLSIWFPRDMASADHWAGFAIGIIIIFVGIRVMRETALQLIDTMPDDRQMNEIRTVAMNVPGALGIEKCFARKTGLRYHVDLHLEVDPELSVRASHEIARAVKTAVRNEVEWVEDVLVHVEPHADVSLTKR